MGPEEKNFLEIKEQPKQKAMFVDDYIDNSELAWMELTQEEPELAEHFEVAYLSHAQNLEEAVEEVLKTNPDIIFMDNNLGGEFSGADGPDVVRAIRAAGFVGVIIGNSTGEAAPFEKRGVAELMDGFLPDKSRGMKVFLEKTLKQK